MLSNKIDRGIFEEFMYMVWDLLAGFFAGITLIGIFAAVLYAVIAIL